MTAPLPAAHFSALNLAGSCQYLVAFARQLEDHWSDRSKVEIGLKALRTYGDLLVAQSPEKEAALFHRLSQGLTYEAGLQHLIAVIVPIERLYTKGFVDTDLPFTITAEDGVAAPTSEPIPLTFVLDNIRSEFNVGSMLRTAECLGVQEVLLCGYTALPQENRPLKAAMGAENVLRWRHFAHVEQAISALHSSGVTVFAAETVHNAPTLFETPFPQPAALVFGNERYGLSPQTLQLCDAYFRIPTFGQKNSLNVAVTCGMAGLEVRRQWS